MLKDYKFLSESIHLVFSAHQEIGGTELHIQNEHTNSWKHTAHINTQAQWLAINLWSTICLWGNDTYNYIILIMAQISTTCTYCMTLLYQYTYTKFNDNDVSLIHIAIYHINDINSAIQVKGMHKNCWRGFSSCLTISPSMHACRESGGHNPQMLLRQISLPFKFLHVL